MAKDPYKPRTPLIGMVMVFLALGIVGVTAYFHEALTVPVSVIGYLVALVVAAFGCWFVFKDAPAPPGARGPDRGPDRVASSKEEDRP